MGGFGWQRVGNESFTRFVPSRAHAFIFLVDHIQYKLFKDESTEAN